MIILPPTADTGISEIRQVNVRTVLQSKCSAKGGLTAVIILLLFSSVELLSLSGLV